MAVIPAFGKQRKGDCHKFKTSVIYIASSRTVRDTEKRHNLKGKRRGG